MPCYEIPVLTIHGKRICSKWGNTPADALGFLKKSMGTKSGLGVLEFGDPYLTHPQPFSDESRAIAAARSAVPSITAKAPEATPHPQPAADMVLHESEEVGPDTSHMEEAAGVVAQAA